MFLLGCVPVRLHLHPATYDSPSQRHDAAEGQGLARLCLQLAVRPLHQPLDAAALRIFPLRNPGAAHLPPGPGHQRGHSARLHSEVLPDSFPPLLSADQDFERHKEVHPHPAVLP